jgi:hypothetical protein
MNPSYSLLAIILPLAHTFTINTPNSVISGDNDTTVTWTSVAGDPSVFNLFLSNPPLFNTDFALVPTVSTSLGTVTFAMPIVQPT